MRIKFPRKSHSLAVPSMEQVRIYFPSGEKAIELIQAEWPLNEWPSLPFVSQSLTIPSPEPTRIYFPSGEKLIALAESQITFHTNLPFLSYRLIKLSP